MFPKANHTHEFVIPFLNTTLSVDQRETDHGRRSYVGRVELCIVCSMHEALVIVVSRQFPLIVEMTDMVETAKCYGGVRGSGGRGEPAHA